MITMAVGGLRLGVETLDLACCAVEVAAATHVHLAAAGPDAPGAPDAHVLLVAGTVTRAAAPIVLARWAALPEPRFVVSYGACAATGGPYWDSYAVVPGVAELLPVDLYVPGCPPPPEAVVAALAELAATLAADPDRLAADPDRLAPSRGGGA